MYVHIYISFPPQADTSADSNADDEEQGDTDGVIFKWPGEEGSDDDADDDLEIVVKHFGRNEGEGEIEGDMSGIRSNDSKANLRVFTDDPDGPSAAMKNGRNRAKLNSNNTSGIRGIQRVKKRNHWYWKANINNNIGHKIQQLFREDDDGLEKAIEQRANWVKQFGYYNS